MRGAREGAMSKTDKTHDIPEILKTPIRLTLEDIKQAENDRPPESIQKQIDERLAAVSDYYGKPLAPENRELVEALARDRFSDAFEVWPEGYAPNRKWTMWEKLILYTSIEQRKSEGYTTDSAVDRYIEHFGNGMCGRDGMRRRYYEINDLIKKESYSTQEFLEIMNLKIKRYEDLRHDIFNRLV
jgi:hypothetical protein